LPKEILQIPFKDKIINLHFEEFDQDIDVDQLTSLDVFNLHAEIITIPALMNRVGIWKAEAENAYADFKLSQEIFSAQRAEHYRKNLITEKLDYKNQPKAKYPTKDEVDDAVLLDEGVQLRRRKVIRLKKDAEYMDSLYWAIKSKEGKLNRMSENMGFTPEDFEKELTEGKFNGIMVKIREKSIK
jgi:hypothetical protein